MSQQQRPCVAHHEVANLAPHLVVDDELIKIWNHRWQFQFLIVYELWLHFSRVICELSETEPLLCFSNSNSIFIEAGSRRTPEDILHYRLCRFDSLWWGHPRKSLSVRWNRRRYGTPWPNLFEKVVCGCSCFMPSKNDMPIHRDSSTRRRTDEFERAKIFASHHVVQHASTQPKTVATKRFRLVRKRLFILIDIQCSMPCLYIP